MLKKSSYWLIILFTFLVNCYCLKITSTTNNVPFNQTDIFQFSFFKKAHTTSKNTLHLLVKKFIDRDVSFLYNTLGEPDKNTLIIKPDTPENNQIIYKYMYNFNKQDYDCVIIFLTDKEHKKVVDVNILSNTCYMITMY